MRTTIFSPCRTYRYVLWREWDMTNPSYLNVIGLNPSTADESVDDPTIRKCVGFAKRFGFGALCMTNLFAYRATDPDVMKVAEDPEGPMNNDHIIQSFKGAGLAIAAWGVHGAFRRRDIEVLELFYWTKLNLHCLRRNRDGSPGHPLYIPYTAKPLLYSL
jgi:hypothetical protein